MTLDHTEIASTAPDADVLIVGAGAVGIGLAVLLARRGKRVTLLEGGPLQPRIDFRDANQAHCTGRAHLGLREGRMKALGGTTRLWGGQLVPFTPEDLAAGSFPGKTGWPISYADLASATDRAYDLLGVPPGARDGDALFRKTTGLEPRLDGDVGIALTSWLPQPDFAKLFGADLSGLSGLTVLTDHAVTDLEFARPGEVSAVIVSGPDGMERRLRAPCVVLANGTFELCRLLLQVAAARPECGFSDNRHLGRWFIDHLHGIVGRVEDINRRRIGALFDPIYREGRKFTVKLRASAALQQSAGIPNAAAMLLAPMGVREIVNDLKTLGRRLLTGNAGVSALVGSLRNMLLLVPVIFRYLVQRRAANLFDRGAHLGIEVEQVATQESYVFLDKDDPSKVGLHWAIDGAEMAAITTLSKAIRDRFAADGLGKVVLDPRVEAGDPAFLEECHDAYHQMGGARMGTSAQDGVVDSQLKVFGTSNLYVLGAATFPSGSFANPTLTALALAVRLSDHLSVPAKAT